MQTLSSMKWPTKTKSLKFRKRVITMSIPRFSSQTATDFSIVLACILTGIQGISPSCSPGNILHIQKAVKKHNPTVTWVECFTFIRMMVFLWTWVTLQKLYATNPLRMSLVPIWYRCHIKALNESKLKPISPLRGLWFSLTWKSRSVTARKASVKSSLCLCTLQSAGLCWQLCFCRCNSQFCFISVTNSRTTGKFDMLICLCICFKTKLWLLKYDF